MTKPFHASTYLISVSPDFLRKVRVHLNDYARVVNNAPTLIDIAMICEQIDKLLEGE